MFLAVFLFLALVIFGFYMMASAISKQNEEYEKEYLRLVQSVKRCPPEPGTHHDWSHHPSTNKLTCTKCNFEAGSHVE